MYYALADRRPVLALLAAVTWWAGGLPLPAAESAGGTEPPPVQMFVPGFSVRVLPVELTNLNHVEYAPDGRLFAAGYDARLHVLRDTDGDGLEDSVSTFSDETGGDYPLGMAFHDGSLYVAFRHEVARFRDTDGDGDPDRREVAVGDWDEQALHEHPLLKHRRVDYGMGLAVAPNGDIYLGVGNAAYDNPYVLDEQGVSRYDPKNRRGCVLRFSSSGELLDQFVTGTRYLMCLRFDSRGELFATDQEGATWLPNGNPFDELLHLERGKHYGFPPRHPKHLPDVVDEPSVFDYRPQHQSLCGFRFNGDGETGPRFGPAWWGGDVFVTAFSRGKLHRTKLAATPAGYVAQSQPIGNVAALPVDLSISPGGDLVVACHSGEPDWGTGPTGRGLLYKIRHTGTETPSPVLAWSAGPGEFRVCFDRELAPESLRSLSKSISITGGQAVFAGHRFETVRPGYEVVKRQATLPRPDLPVLSSSVTPDRRTLVFNTPPATLAVDYAIAIGGLRRESNPEGEGLPQEPSVDVQTDLCGVAAEWRSDEGADLWRGWLPHLDLDVAESFTAASAEHARLRESWNRSGTLTLKGQLDLWRMLQPAVQPGSRLDYEPPTEQVTVTFASPRPFSLALGGGKAEPATSSDGVYRSTAKVEGREADWLRYEIVLRTGREAPDLTVSWHTEADDRPRAFALRRFLLPWAQPDGGTSSGPVRRAAVPELAGGDSRRGRQVFFGEAAACHKCHRLRGEGGKVGPDLSNLIHRDYESALRDVVDPGAVVNPEYLAYTVVTADGRVLTGTIHEETADALVLADGTGKLTTIPRREVEEVAPSPGSVMPSGLAKILSEEQIRDLLTFLLTDPAEVRGNDRRVP